MQNFNFDDKNIVTGKLNKTAKKSGNKDLVLSYRLAGDKIETGLLLYESKDENFFLAVVQPPKRPSVADIPPREYIFIIDVSGSMSGYPLDISKKLLKDLLSHLRAVDKFNIMYFAGNSSLLSETSLSATSTNINNALQDIENKSGGGSTELLPALKIALNLKGTEDYSRSFVIVTDGYINVEKEAFDLIRNNLNKANFYAFGIGSSVNRFLIEGIAHVGQGEPLIILNQSEAQEKADKFRKYIQQPVLTNIDIKYSGFNVYHVEPLSYPDVLAQRPLLIYGKYKGKAKGKIEIRGKTGERDFKKILEIKKAKKNNDNSALKYLWARKKIQMIDDYASAGGGGWNEQKIYDNDMQNEVTKLGLKYNLLTNYTSFIAIDNQIRNKDGKSETVKQPLPLPEGVSNNAVPRRKKGLFRSFNKGKRSQNALMSEKFGAVNELVIVEDEIDIDDEVEIVEIEEEYEKEEALVFFIVEEMPEFIGNEEYEAGTLSLQKFIADNLTYPKSAKENNIEGRVYISFVIDIDGSVIDVKVARGVNIDLDNEAMRVIKLTSKMWKAGKQRGKPVKVSMSLAINFKLTQ